MHAYAYESVSLFIISLFKRVRPWAQLAWLRSTVPVCLGPNNCVTEDVLIRIA